jgi:hypothetical protein
LRQDDPRLAQGATTTPPPLACNSERPVEGCCPIGWCGWKGERLETVGEIEEFFARCCYEADLRLGEPGVCRWFLNWFDDTPREQMRLELLFEVQRLLEQRFFTQTIDRIVRRRKRAPRRQVSAA